LQQVNPTDVKNRHSIGLMLAVNGHLHSRGENNFVGSSVAASRRISPPLPGFKQGPRPENLRLSAARYAKVIKASMIDFKY
jgi:hypothetical protein